MRQTFFTVGPSQIYPTYTQHLQTAMDLHLGSIGHRTSTFRKIYQHTVEQLQILLNIPTSHAIFFTPSATEIWERILLNTVKCNSFHFVNGAFSQRFYEYAVALQKSPELHKVNHGEGFDFSTIIIPEENELICTTQNETASGVQIPVADLVQLKQKYPSQLLCTDIVSSAPISNINYSYIDSSFFSVQKAFGMPPGLGVWIVNEACIQKAKELESIGMNIGAHHTISSFYKNYQAFETPSTPNIIAIYIVGKIAEDFNKIGIENMRKTSASKAKLLYDFVDNNSMFQPHVTNTNHRSETVVVLNTKEDSSIFLQAMAEQSFIISSGYSKYKKSQIRIPNFPSTTEEQMAELIYAMEKVVSNE
jgi:phosphoserine aminotransferase